MTPAIGAGTQILMATAATPMSAFSAGGSDGNLVDVTEYFTSFATSLQMNAVDVTKLDVGTAQAWARQFIAGLKTATASGNYGDNVQLTFLRKILAIQDGVLHTVKGRGHVDFKINVGGAATGNGRIQFSGIFTQSDSGAEIETPLGGSFSIQVSGKFQVDTQP